MLTQTFLNTTTRTLTEEPTGLASITPVDGKFLISGATGKYLKIGVYKGQYLWSDGNETSTKWTIEAPEGAETDKLFYIYTDDFTETHADVAGKTMYITGTNASSAKPAMAQWVLVTGNDYQSYITGESDGIEGIENEKMKNGENENAVYDLSGRRVSASSALHKGIYIINGKKFINK